MIPMPKTKKRDSEATRAAVRAGYASVARGQGGCCGTTPSCCGSKAPTPDDVARAVGYSDADLAPLPEGANMGLSCGNPTAIASLKPGEVVLDLGSGGGFDVFIAARKVGPKGRAIGVDMTAEMVAKARENAAAFRERTKLNNVEFRLGEIEHLPVADSTVDVVISNCVINLSPDKPQVWREIARILRPGGRVAVSDVALLKPLPRKIAEMVEALVGCIAGAVPVRETLRMAKAAGLVDITSAPDAGFVQLAADSNDPLYRKVLAALPKGTKPGDYLASVTFSAHKPG
jgi:SAM-dependent methyltransferase